MTQKGYVCIIGTKFIVSLYSFVVTSCT